MTQANILQAEWLILIFQRPYIQMCSNLSSFKKNILLLGFFVSVKKKTYKLNEDKRQTGLIAHPIRLL